MAILPEWFLKLDTVHEGDFPHHWNRSQWKLLMAALGTLLFRNARLLDIIFWLSHFLIQMVQLLCIVKDLQITILHLPENKGGLLPIFVNKWNTWISEYFIIGCCIVLSITGRSSKLALSQKVTVKRLFDLTKVSKLVSLKLLSKFNMCLIITIWLTVKITTDTSNHGFTIF